MEHAAETMAVARGAQQGAHSLPTEVLVIGGAGVLWLLAAGFRYMRRLVLEDDERQQRLRTEYVSMRSEIQELRQALAEVRQAFALCEQERRHQEAQILAIQERLERRG
jgi:hypothetical protein